MKIIKSIGSVSKITTHPYGNDYIDVVIDALEEEKPEDKGFFNVNRVSLIDAKFRFHKDDVKNINIGNKVKLILSIEK